ncbi:MAG TPA: glutamine--tRNA ligase, partial [bacterium]|nr:glutamine--tRNA ligase [bacterium]
HWVAIDHALPAEFRLYNRLFAVANPERGDVDFTENLNPESLEVRRGFIESSVANDPYDQRYQLERVGYFWRDPEFTASDRLVFSQIVPLRDTWAEREEAERQAEIERQRLEKEREKARQRKRSEAGQRDPVEDLTSAQKTRFKRYREEMGLDREDAAIIAREDEVADFFEEALRIHNNPLSLSNWIVNRLLGIRKDIPLKDLPIDAEQFARLVTLLDEDVISSRAADQVFEQMVAEGGNPETIVDREGLRQIEDTDALEPVVQEVIAAHPDEVERYRSGKKGLLGFFMGQIMQKTGGSANPELAKELLTQTLNDS